jgi:glycosyltransferase involved in cell wall biosynthesis
MKIVHVETGRHLYGGAQQVLWLHEGLAERDVESLLVCPQGSGLDLMARQRGAAVVNLPCSGDLDLKFAWQLRQLLRAERPDIVHCHSRRGADFLGGQAARLAGIPAVLSRRVDNPESPFVARLRYGPFQRVIAISENVSLSLHESGLSPDRVTIIRSGVNVEDINQTPDCAAFREEFEIDSDDFAIAIVAQLLPRKGHRFLFDVIPNLRDTHPGMRVVVFGSGSGETQLRALAAQLNLGGTVQFAGFRDDLDSYLACFDLLVHPATREGLGVAMLKAAAAALPVVAFDVAGATEAVIHGKTGVLVPAGDVRLLQKAIGLMIEEPEMCQEFGAAGRQRMLDDFSIGIMVEGHIDLYESLLND